MAESHRLRVAAVQAAPVFLDAGATVDKAVGLIEEAAAEGARLVAFGEGFLPGHPIWLHVQPVTSPTQIALASELIGAAVTVPGPETDRLVGVARKTGTTVVMGAVERLDRGSSLLALAVLVIGPDGSLERRRKLVPAVGERVLFTPGAGDSIRVFQTAHGPISVLLGGENSNPLLTWTLRELGSRLHLALWPPHFNKPGVMGETATITGRAIAYQNSAYVVSVFGAADEATRERIAAAPRDRELLDAMAADPGSSVYAPRGAVLAGPASGGETILYADLDLGAGAWPSLVNRQYDRPDLFSVTVDRSPRPIPLALRGGGTVPEPAAGDRAAGDGAASRARRLIADRYGDRLAPDDLEQLVPYVAGVLDTSARLGQIEAEGGLGDPLDPAGGPSFADDLRSAP